MKVTHGTIIWAPRAYEKAIEVRISTTKAGVLTSVTLSTANSAEG
jgi:hypothetical protein